MTTDLNPEPSTLATKPPKVALVHDWLDRRVGGAEQVLLELARLYPDAPVYTLVFDERRWRKLIDAGRVRPSWLNRLPAAIKSRAKLLLPFVPRAIESFDLSEYDIVISSSGAWSKNVITPRRALHVCYCHSPARFLWDYRDRYIKELASQLPNRWLAWGLKQIVQFMTKRLRRWDYLASGRVDVWLANSQHVADRIARFYDQNADVLYPPVDIARARPTSKKGDYYMTLSTLTPYKKLDLVIRAFNTSGRKLVVVGDGPQRAELEQLAGDNIEFTGYIDEPGKWQLLKRARGLIYAHEEDLGIAPVEALASNTPVIAYRRGGARETVTDGKTGILFDKQTVAAINTAVKRADNLNINDELSQSVTQFSRQTFERQFTEIVDRHFKTRFKQRFEEPLSLLGVPIHAVNIDDAVDFITDRLQQPRLSQLATVNVEFVMMAQSEPEFKAILDSSQLNVADGIGIVWALHWRTRALRRTLWTWLTSIAAIVFRPRTLRAPLAERVTGVDLVDKIAQAAEANGRKLYLLGARHGAAQAAGRNLQAKYPGLIIAGSESGSPDTSLDEAITSRINASGADILLVAYGPPKQERWIKRNEQRLSSVRVAFGVGGTFDYIARQARRAPNWLQAIGLEWLWRLLMEPKRLRRQLTIPRFMYKVYKSRHK